MQVFEEAAGAVNDLRIKMTIIGLSFKVADIRD